MPSTFFGIGAQKAATTWLYDLLQRYPDCAPTPVKEMHFFDTKYGNSTSAVNFIAEFTNLADRTAQIANRVQKLKDKGNFDRVDYSSDPLDAKVDDMIDNVMRIARRLKVRDSASYVAYMEEWRRTSGAPVVGEITPAYSTLPAEGFAEIDSLYPEAKFIFIMRDPVDRFWSQIRFFISKRGKEVAPDALVNRMLKREDFQLRSDYPRTIEALESVVPRERIFYSFFETLTAPATAAGEVRRLEAFLGLGPMAADALEAFANRPSNTSPSAKMSPESRARLRSELGYVYDFVERRWPDDMPERWRIHDPQTAATADISPLT